MKPFTRQNHYEVLELSPAALPLEIRRAYKKAVSLYEDDAIASYSFFPARERKEILACIESAYLTLINPEARSAYDRLLASQGIPFDGENAEQERTREPVAIYDFQKSNGYGSSQALRIAELKTRVAQSPLIRECLAQDTLMGADLKRLRTCLQVTLEEISCQTNIRIEILRAIEEDQRELLPPAVYLKGFLKSYSRCLALDEQVVVTAYLRGIGNAGSPPPKQV